MAGMYAVYHGPKGLRKIASRVHEMAFTFADGLVKLGLKVTSETFFDTVQLEVDPKTASSISEKITKLGYNIRDFGEGKLGFSFDETTRLEDVSELLACISPFSEDKNPSAKIPGLSQELQRTTTYLEHPVFNIYHSETELLRYITRLQNKDLSLAVSMIPLGSCTMKLNASAEMMPVSLSGFSRIHPFAPKEQTQGYLKLIKELEGMLAEITGLPAVSLQPNAGSQGEYAGLLAIRHYLDSQDQTQRITCIIPQSAHGTNPASAILAGMKVVVVKCDENGNIDVADLRKKAEDNKETLAALMVTYPSTHGVFEESIVEICKIVHENGGQVYMDGANLNAQVGLCRPGEFGVDVCHLNLHKTFCIPHGGGGPGVGPIAAAEHLSPFMPGTAKPDGGFEGECGPVCTGPYGSASILPISWAYIKLMGASGLTKATQVAILNANYIAKRLEGHFDVLYRGANGLVAHECILDLRQFKRKCQVEVADVAKRLMDYGFHAPTVSWPVIETMMVEPTESESREELDRFCESLIAIREEIAEVEQGLFTAEESVLKNAPHSTERVCSDTWNYKYSREKAAYPLAWIRDRKFWPASSRIDNSYGDRNFFCSCIPIDVLSE
jgi:glycine dehydrogenase